MVLKGKYIPQWQCVLKSEETWSWFTIKWDCSFKGLQTNQATCFLPSGPPLFYLSPALKGSGMADEFLGGVLDVEELHGRRWHFLLMSYEECLFSKLICRLSEALCAHFCCSVFLSVPSPWSVVHLCMHSVDQNISPKFSPREIKSSSVLTCRKQKTRAKLKYLQPYRFCSLCLSRQINLDAGQIMCCCPQSHCPKYCSLFHK